MLPSNGMDIGVPDEATLIATLAVLAVLQGWTVVTDGGITWFLSNGATGDKLIVGGLEALGTRKIRGYTAADLDQFAIVNATVKGYTNDDSANTTAVGAKVLAPTNDTQWQARGVGTTMSYVASVSQDAVTCILKYNDSVNNHQGFLYIGSCVPTAGGPLQTSAYARIAAIDASVPATTVVTLDRDINAALKDSYLQDPYATPAPLFQSVATAGMPVSDFALTQRCSILPGSLTLSGGATQFQIDATAAGKLTGTPGGTPARYRAGRGVGDVVRLCAEPNLVCVTQSIVGGFPVAAGSQTYLTAWDAFGGQGAALDVKIFNTDSVRQANNKPAGETNKWVCYPIYAEVMDKATTMLPQPDNQGQKTVGALTNAIAASFTAAQITDFAMIYLDGRRTQRYRQLTAGWLGMISGNTIVAVGPGW